VLLTARELPSTQNLMQENAAAQSAAAAAAPAAGEGASIAAARDAIPAGAVCVADSQCSGRGRGGNVWSSPPGCLMVRRCRLTLSDSR
jgi:biotin--protein ligase